MLADSHGAPLTNIILAFDVRGTEEALGEFGSRFTMKNLLASTGEPALHFARDQSCYGLKSISLNCLRKHLILYESTMDKPEFGIKTTE